MNSSRCSKCQSELKQGAKFCAVCGTDVSSLQTKIPSSSRAVKNPFTPQAKRIYFLIAAALFSFFIYLFITHLPGGAHPVIAAQPEIAMATMNIGMTITPEPIDVEIRGGKITFPLSTLLQYHAVSFEYTTPTGVVPLLAFVSPEGKLVTSIRMCEPCDSKNFKIEGTELACGNCETRWKLSNLEGLQGSCQKYPPDPIPSTVEGNHIFIDEKVVQNWKMRI